MPQALAPTEPHLQGIVLRLPEPAQRTAARAALAAQLDGLGLLRHVRIDEVATATGTGLQALLQPPYDAQWMPGFDTLGLCGTLGLDTERHEEDLDREILLALLRAPIAFAFPSHDELVSALRVRRHIVQAARRTTLAFDTTDAAERPADYWHDDAEQGFLLRPGRSLIDALVKATQPEASGKLYSFSCYRATEYVILLGLARELRAVNPPLFEQLEQDSRRRTIRSGRFHDVFLYEYGVEGGPLPARYYVPGDRLWFRNPDEASADVTGYEGSWVFYLGSGLFTNFWKRDQPFTFTGKCVEIYHWRDGLVHDAQGQPQMDERIVERRVAETLRDPAAVGRILARMVRLRDPRGVYAEGGCIDNTREYPRQVRPGTADITLPGPD